MSMMMAHHRSAITGSCIVGSQADASSLTTRQVRAPPRPMASHPGPAGTGPLPFPPPVPSSDQEPEHRSAESTKTQRGPSPAILSRPVRLYSSIVDPGVDLGWVEADEVPELDVGDTPLETTLWSDGQERYRLALTILQLSTGWQLRDPLDVRKRELWADLALRYRSYCLMPKPVFSLEPGALHAARNVQTAAPDGFGAELGLMYHAVTSTLADFDTMLDAEHLPSNEPGTWAVDLQHYTDAEVTTDDLSDWTLRRSKVAVPSMPALGLFREVLHEKLVNRHTQWEPNDLTDLVYLTCAAGYANHVVGEHSATGYIRNAQRRLGRTVNVHRNLKSLMAELHLQVAAEPNEDGSSTAIR
jgi:hypothetical protein